MFLDYCMTASKFFQILLSLLILVRCLRSMVSEHYEPEIWAYIRYRGTNIPVEHWENTIGRSPSADVRIADEGVSRIHAVLSRNDKGHWKLYDIFSRGGVWVNGNKIGADGLVICDGDTIKLGSDVVSFHDITTAKRKKLEAKRTGAGRRVSPAVTLVYLTLFQLFLMLQLIANLAEYEHFIPLCLSFAGIIVLEWFCYIAMRILYRNGFEPEIIAFYLTSLGLCVTVSSAPEDIYKQLFLTCAAILLFLLLGWWLRNLKRAAAMRVFFGVVSLGLLALNVLTAESIFGARNWLTFGGFSFQPSELVKVGYVYVGASTLDKLYRKQNLFSYIVFSAINVIALALMGDFGTALVFFVCFLVIAYLRSGSIATLILAVSGAGMAGLLAVSARPYIAKRFATWGHVWEDVYGAGYQQTHALSAAASGGLFGKGAGAGWLKEIAAANTDMVFAVICEELGLIIAIAMVLMLLALAVFTVRTAGNGRSAYYAIAACAAAVILVSQTALNVFGSLDILPFTGVTFPFVSKGGTSLLACWMLLAFIKSADNRRNASFAVNAVSTIESYSEVSAEAYDGGATE